MLAFILCTLSLPAAEIENFDVIVYGGSSAGVIAAVQAAVMGKATLLITETPHLGGMTASGLGTADVGNPDTIGGLAARRTEKTALPAAWVGRPPPSTQKSF